MVMNITPFKVIRQILVGLPIESS